MIARDYDKNNHEIAKENILFVNAQTGYRKDALIGAGFRSVHPYNYRTIIGRIILEIVVKLHISQKFLFNKQILNFKGKYVIVFDPLVTSQFMRWLVESLPQCKIIYFYCNVIGKARHISPDKIPNNVIVWTYDQNDAKKYGIKLTKGGYSTFFISEKAKKLYDVVYVGRDKSRAAYLLELEEKMREQGLKTRFLIMPDTKISKRKKFYSREIEYSEVIKLVSQSRAVLNIVLPDQMGATMRDFESIFNEVKLITNNRNIKNYSFYDENNVFILGEKKIDDIKKFIEIPYKCINDDILKEYTLTNQIKAMLEES